MMHAARGAGYCRLCDKVTDVGTFWPTRGDGNTYIRFCLTCGNPIEHGGKLWYSTQYYRALWNLTITETT